MTRERRLSELDPKWWPSMGAADATEARGVRFTCPACSAEHGDRLHQIMVQWTPPSTNGEQLWKLLDGTLETLTLSPSIDCTQGGGCKFHGWVQGGLVRW